MRISGATLLYVIEFLPQNPLYSVSESPGVHYHSYTMASYQSYNMLKPPEPTRNQSANQKQVYFLAVV